VNNSTNTGLPNAESVAVAFCAAAGHTTALHATAHIHASRTPPERFIINLPPLI
jgi:hypothetical protein